MDETNDSMTGEGESQVVASGLITNRLQEIDGLAAANPIRCDGSDADRSVLVVMGDSIRP